MTSSTRGREDARCRALDRQLGKPFTSFGRPRGRAAGMKPGRHRRRVRGGAGWRRRGGGRAERDEAGGGRTLAATSVGWMVVVCEARAGGGGEGRACGGRKQRTIARAW